MTRAPQLLSAATLAARLDIPKRTAYDLLNSGQFPVTRLGRSVRVSEADLSAFLATRTTPTVRSRVRRISAA
jgi:excisionase family DNA binding protein